MKFNAQYGIQNIYIFGSKLHFWHPPTPRRRRRFCCGWRTRSWRTAGSGGWEGGGRGGEHLGPPRPARARGHRGHILKAGAGHTAGARACGVTGHARSCTRPQTRPHSVPCQARGEGPGGRRAAPRARSCTQGPGRSCQAQREAAQAAPSFVARPCAALGPGGHTLTHPGGRTLTHPGGRTLTHPGGRP
jgi:hypothetical protein